MGERVWLKGVYLRELMVHVSVHHVLSLGYKFMYGVQAVFFLHFRSLQSISTKRPIFPVETTGD